MTPLHEIIDTAVTTAARAPSVHNTQPWEPGTPVIDGDEAWLEVGVDPSRTLPAADPSHMDLLLGLGWSCGLIAGSTLVTESVGEAQRPAAQGGTDLLMGLGAALAGVVGGPLLTLGGYGLVAGVSAALVVPLVVVLLLGRSPAGAPAAPDAPEGVVSGPGSSAR